MQTLGSIAYTVPETVSQAIILFIHESTSHEVADPEHTYYQKVV